MGILTPRRSDKLCPASASSEAEFIHKPAKPFVTVRVTLLPRPAEASGRIRNSMLAMGRGNGSGSDVPSNVIRVPRSTFPERKALMICSAPSEWSCTWGWKIP